MSCIFLSLMGIITRSMCGDTDDTHIKKDGTNGKQTSENRKNDCCTSERKGGQSTHIIKDVY